MTPGSSNGRDRSAATVGNTRILEIDGIRGLAICLVVAYHYIHDATYPPEGTLGYYALVPMRLFWVGLDMFFVLSGFLIGGILVDNKESSNYFRAF